MGNETLRSRKICVITGTRAEYGLLRALMGELREASDMELQIIATGAHLAEAHGNTLHEIETDGFKADETVDMLLAADSARAIGISMGLGTIGLVNALDRLAPDMVVLLGDRYEALAAAQCAMILGIPIAHIHGGEATEGSIDEAIRHSITKMAHVHFVAAEPYRRRVIQLGEQPNTVHIVGAAGLDNVFKLDAVDKSTLEELLGMPLTGPLFLVTYHPVTLARYGAAGIDALFEALDRYADAHIIFTGSNADANGVIITEKIKTYCAERSGQAKYFPSLGYQNYLSLMVLADVVIGNSSSGLLEAPTVGVTTVNIGPRQRGRLRAASVIDVGESAAEIYAGLESALSDKARVVATRRHSPYGKPGAAKRMIKVLREVELDGILLKRFYNL
jgi:UDP-hydrolysing UDP-N-acetyl-D-glucosamine 2-epimerase